MTFQRAWWLYMMTLTLWIGAGVVVGLVLTVRHTDRQSRRHAEYVAARDAEPRRADTEAEEEGDEL